MKRVLVTIVLLVLLSGCLEEKPLSFFARDGVRVGTPTKEGDRFRLPVEFTTAIVHSGQWLYDASVTINADTIVVTAVFTRPPGLKQSRYRGFVDLGSAKPGTYQVRYRDPTGTTHDLCSVILR